LNHIVRFYRTLQNSAESMYRSETNESLVFQLVLIVIKIGLPRISIKKKKRFVVSQ
jgi:hypothetical protein